MKQYVGLSRDHSGSMNGLDRAAMNDYNQTIGAIKKAAVDQDIDTVTSVVSFQNSVVKCEVVNSGIDRLRPLTSYPTGGGTPLFDSVGELITMLERTPDANDKNVTFLVVAITDGEDNESPNWKNRIGDKIRALQATDRWTFVFRVPRGYSRRLQAFGIPSGNIQEWEQTERGFQEATVATQSAVSNYFKGVKSGVRSTRTFYADMKNVSAAKVASAMNDISDEVTIYPVKTRQMIEPFAINKVGGLVRGQWFYQLSKPEKAVQDYKVIVVRNKNTGAVYGGGDARQLLNLPDTGTISLKPGNHGEWDIFVQSTSNNRILVPNTSVLRWEK